MEATEERLRAQLAELDARLEKLAAAPESVLCIECARRAGR